MREGGDVTGVSRVVREGGAADVAHAKRGRKERGREKRREEGLGRCADKASYRVDPAAHAPAPAS